MGFLELTHYQAKLFILILATVCSDGGAEKGKAIEKDIALSVSLKLRDYLQQQGALVLITREYDYDLQIKIHKD